MERFQTNELTNVIHILWMKKWILIFLMITGAITALGLSLNTTPVYTASAKIALGNFSNEIFTQPQTVQQYILSNDFLKPVMKKLNLNPDVETFRKSISVKTIDKTRLIEIESHSADSEMAQKITAELTAAFIEKNNDAYQEKKEPIEQLLSTMQKQYEQLGQSLNRNKAALTAIETNPNLTNLEKDLSRARLIDYIVRDENMINSITTSIRDVQVKLKELQKAEVIEHADYAVKLTSTSPQMSAVIGLVAGFMVGLFYILLIDYLTKNLIRIKKEPNNSSD